MDVISFFPGLQASQHMLCALQVEWDKGHALAHLLGALGLDGAEDVLPIYIGDDRCVIRHWLIGGFARNADRPSE